MHWDSIRITLRQALATRIGQEGRLGLSGGWGGVGHALGFN